jgi:hypothetical protein
MFSYVLSSVHVLILLLLLLQNVYLLLLLCSILLVLFIYSNVNDYIGGLAGHIMSNDSRSSSNLRSGKPFLSRAPYQPTPGTPATPAAQQQQAANVIPLPTAAAAHATFFGST